MLYVFTSAFELGTFRATKFGAQPLRDQNQPPILQSTPTMRPSKVFYLDRHQLHALRSPRTKLSHSFGYTSMPTIALMRLTLPHCHLNVVWHPLYGEFFPPALFVLPWPF